MIPHILTQLNFLDLIVLVIFLRVCYIGSRMGFSVEIFKLSGVLTATYVSMHYYTRLSDLVQKRFMSGSMPVEFIDFLFFLLLIVAVYFFFVFLRSLLFRFIQLNTIPKINQLAGFILAIARSFLITGLLAYSLAICSVSYVTGWTRHSYIVRQATGISPSTYAWIWNNIVSKFSAHGKYNSTVDEATDKFNRQ